jgi:hypothetical protein
VRESAKRSRLTALALVELIGPAAVLVALRSAGEVVEAAGSGKEAP